MTSLSDWCYYADCPRCRSPFCGCGCHETPVSQGGTTSERDTMGAQIKTAPMGALTPNTGASPTGLESTDA